MRHCSILIAFATIAVLCCSTTDSVAQFYAIDNYDGHVYSYVDTIGTWVNPDTLVPWTVGAAVDHEGRLLLATDGPWDLVRLDMDAQTIDYIETSSPAWTAVDVAVDISDDIYLLMEETGMRAGNYIAILHGGTAPQDTAYSFGYSTYPLDMVVRPTGPRAGNILALIDSDGYYIIEIERTETDSFNYYGLIADTGMMPGSPTGIAYDPDGMLVLVDFYGGLYYVDEEYGYVWGFGSTTNTGLTDMSIAADGTIYAANTLTHRIERFDSDGYPIGGPFGSTDLNYLSAIAAVGYTPTPEGDNVFIEPGENIEVTYESVTSSGFTTAVVETTTDRVSPEGNYLPDDAQLPGGTRATSFAYIGLSTDAVYEGLIQVDVLEEGSRLFFASGTGDTFRDFTVVGSIEDARGTIPRFSEFPMGSKRVETGPTEVVLVDDDRTLPEVVAYKFWRLELAMDVPDNMPGGDPCPWEYIKWLQKYQKSASDYYDLGQYANALSELAIMNGLIRSHAGWCIPDSSDDPLDNLVGHLLAHSKTLMYTIELESGDSFTGIDEGSSAISLTVTSPARGECRLALSGPMGTEVAARIYSVSGRLVATVYEGTLPEGGETIVWNGVDETGRPIASGVYFARVESASDVLTSKVVFIR